MNVTTIDGQKKAELSKGSSCPMLARMKIPPHFPHQIKSSTSRAKHHLQTSYRLEITEDNFLFLEVDTFRILKSPDPNLPVLFPQTTSPDPD